MISPSRFQVAELPPFLTLAQTAQIYQCSIEHIRRMYRAGKLPGAFETMGLIRVRTSVLLGGGE